MREVSLRRRENAVLLPRTGAKEQISCIPSKQGGVGELEGCGEGDRRELKRRKMNEHVTRNALEARMPVMSDCRVRPPPT